MALPSHASGHGAVDRYAVPTQRAARDDKVPEAATCDSRGHCRGRQRLRHHLGRGGGPRGPCDEQYINATMQSELRLMVIAIWRQLTLNGGILTAFRDCAKTRS